jgi:hypothetical protein
MRGTPDVGGIYPLSTIPVEGYGASPEERTGKIVITHVNGKFIKSTDDGHTFVEKAHEATQYNDHAEASLAAAKLIAKAQGKVQAMAVEGAPV